MRIRLNQLPHKTEDLVQRMLKGDPAARISAQDSMQHHYFSTLPPPVMHLRDSKIYLCMQSHSAKKATCLIIMLQSCMLCTKRATCYHTPGSLQCLNKVFDPH